MLLLEKKKRHSVHKQLTPDNEKSTVSNLIIHIINPQLIILTGKYSPLESGAKRGEYASLRIKTYFYESLKTCMIYKVDKRRRGDKGCLNCDKLPYLDFIIPLDSSRAPNKHLHFAHCRVSGVGGCVSARES